MGCASSSSRQIASPAVRINNIDDIHVNPGTFILHHSQNFQDIYILGHTLRTTAKYEFRNAIHRETQEERTVKIFRKDFSTSESYSNLQTEISILKSIDHPNIIKIFEIFEEAKRVFVVMEQCKGGELFEQILSRECFSETQVANIIKELFSAVAYLHMKMIVHRDIKPESILLEEKGGLLNIKLINFSVATILPIKNCLSGIVGSAYYIPPEMITGTYSEKCDMWSCGVVMFMLLSHYPPFEGNSNQEILDKIISSQLNFNEAVWDSVSPQAKDLISKLLCPVASRFSASEALSHPWFSLQTSRELPDSQKLLSTFQNLRTFYNSNKLRDAVQTYIATQCISSYDSKELKEVFRAIDTNGDGQLSKEELLEHYIQVLGQENAEEEVTQIMKQVDTEKNGYINYTEFIKAAMSQRTLLSSQNLRRAFDLFDNDKSGTISASELRKVLQGSMVSEDKVWDDIIKHFDQNSDGEIDLREFEEIIIGQG